MRSDIWPVGKRVRRPDGQLLIVTRVTNVRRVVNGFSLGFRIDSGWAYDATYRDATPEEDACFGRDIEITDIEQGFTTLMVPADADRGLTRFFHMCEAPEIEDAEGEASLCREYLCCALDAPKISDKAYDALVRELRAFEHEHPELIKPYSPTQRLGGGLREGRAPLTEDTP